MKKLRILISFLFYISMISPCFGTDWYAQNSSTNINAANQWNSNPAGGGTVLTWGEQADGDNFYANGKTAIAINTDPGGAAVTVTLRTDAGAGTAGGGFTYATANNLTLHANFLAGTTDCIVVTGSTGGLTITGTSTGGSSSGADGVWDSHTVVTTNYNNATGGSNGTAHGINFNGTSGVANLTGTATGATGFGFKCSGAGTGTVVNCVGSSVLAGGYGCRAEGAGAITVTGNIVNGTAEVGAAGKIIYTPSSAQKYVKFDGGGTAVYVSAGLGSDAEGTQITGANTAAQVKTTAYFIKKDDGVYTQGSASGGGGGAWAF